MKITLASFLFLLAALPTLTFSLSAHGKNTSEYFYAEFSYYDKLRSCTSGYNEVQKRAKNKCRREGFENCHLKDWGVYDGPITHGIPDKMRLDGYKYKCKAYAIVTGFNGDGLDRIYEAGLGFGGSYCDKYTAKYGSIMSRMAPQEVSIYTRCVTGPGREYGGVVVGIIPKKHFREGSFELKNIKFTSSKDCLKAVDQDQDEHNFSYVGNENFSLSVWCEKSVLKGIVHIHPK